MAGIALTNQIPQLADQNFLPRARRKLLNLARKLPDCLRPDAVR